MKFIFLTFLLAAISIGMPSHAKSIDASQSSASATATQMGVRVEAPFKKITGDIYFDDQHLDKSSAKIYIDTASFDLGDDSYNREVLKPEWLSAKAHPVAIFVSSSIKPLSAGQYAVMGALNIKGKIKIIRTVFTMSTQAGQRNFKGEFPISRREFDLGGSSWDEMVDDVVLVKFSLSQPL